MTPVRIPSCSSGGVWRRCSASSATTSGGTPAVATPGPCRTSITHLNSTNHFWSLSIAQASGGRADPLPRLVRPGRVARPAGRQHARHAAGGHPRGVPLEQRGDARRHRSPRRRGVGRPSVRRRPATCRSRSSPTTRCGTAGCTSATSCCRSAGRRWRTPGEVLTCLRYAAALGPAFEVGQGGGSGGTAVLEVTDPDARIVVVASRRPGPGPRRCRIRRGAPPVRVAAVPLLEMLSRRDAGRPAPDVVELAHRRARHRLRRDRASPEPA